MHIAICVATFKRPKLLQRLLNGIAELRFVKVEVPEIGVVVVDNDPAGTAREICRNTVLPWRLKYVLEPKRGIAEARNRAVRESGDADFVAFIDDDEAPTNLWLDELLSAQVNFQADAVAGPVYPSFTDDVPEWIRKADFFDRPTHFVAGESLLCCSTNNVLVSRNVFNQVGDFDDRFQLTGGEDVHFFTRVSRAGFNIVWSGDAVVNETISSDRANIGSILRRAYRGGNCYTLVESSLDKRIFPRLVRFFKGCGRILQGLGNACISLVTGRAAALVRAVGGICSGVGMLAGLAGFRYQAYKTVSGDSAE
jgi:succinoglycan biosynthesis protein ExoM